MAGVAFGQVTSTDQSGSAEPITTTKIVLNTFGDGTKIYDALIHVQLPEESYSPPFNVPLTYNASPLSINVGDSIMPNHLWAYCSVNPADGKRIDSLQSSPTGSAREGYNNKGYYSDQSDQFGTEINNDSNNIVLFFDSDLVDWTGGTGTSLFSLFTDSNNYPIPTSPVPLTAEKPGTVKLVFSGTVVLKNYWSLGTSKIITVTVTLPVVVSDPSVAPSAPQTVRAH